MKTKTGLLPKNCTSLCESIRLLPTLNVFESVEELDEYLGNIQRSIVDEDSEF